MTAYERIRYLWTLAAGNGGLLMQERETLPSILDDAATGEMNRLHSGNLGVKPWDAYLAILQLDKNAVKQLKAERSICHPECGCSWYPES